jgi:hypothetical protein
MKEYIHFDENWKCDEDNVHDETRETKALLELEFEDS